MLAKPFQKLSRNGCPLATCGFPSGCLTMIGLPVVFFAGRSANLDNIARSLIDVFCPCCQGTSTPMCDPNADFLPWCFPEFLQTASRVSHRRPKRQRVSASEARPAPGEAECDLEEAKLPLSACDAAFRAAGRERTGFAMRSTMPSFQCSISHLGLG